MQGDEKQKSGKQLSQEVIDENQQSKVLKPASNYPIIYNPNQQIPIYCVRQPMPPPNSFLQLNNLKKIYRYNRIDQNIQNLQGQLQDNNGNIFIQRCPMPVSNQYMINGYNLQSIPFQNQVQFPNYQPQNIFVPNPLSYNNFYNIPMQGSNGQITLPFQLMNTQSSQQIVTQSKPNENPALSYIHNQNFNNNQPTTIAYTNQKINQQEQIEEKQELQISELLTRTRRRELLEYLKSAKTNNQIIINSKLKKKGSKSVRGSIYRGVSRNGKKWQVQLLGNLKKHYIGSINSEVKAAKIYDKHAILTHGLKAKTNFTYTKKQIEKIIERESNDKIYETNSSYLSNHDEEEKESV